MDLKEYTITISSKGEKLVKYAGGDFVVIEVIDSNEKKYSIPKLKKDGTTSVAYDQIQKVSVGETITVGVDEKPKENKDGKSYVARTIRSIKGDEYKVPYTKPTPKTVDIEAGERSDSQGEPNRASNSVSRAEFEALKARVFMLEKDVPLSVENSEEIKEVDLPF